MKKIVFVYFSCERDFYLLEKSIKSLVEIYGEYKSIYIVQDPENKFLLEQQKVLKNSGKNIYLIDHFLKKSAKNGNGIENILKQLSVFEYICNIEKSDYIAKIDSDMLILKDGIFRYVEENKADLVGTKVKYKGESEYIYGCLYFLSQKAVKFLNLEIKNISKVKKYLNEDAKKYFAENRVIYGMIENSKLTKKVFNHEKGYILNLDIFSNYRIAKAYNEKIINPFKNITKYDTVHLWSDIKLYFYVKEKKNRFYMYKKNIKNIVYNILYLIYRLGAKYVKKIRENII